MSKRYVVGLLGNPNCGETTLFNALTGSRQRVGNWPGVTVERKVGHFNLGDLAIELIDLRGTYSLEVGDDAVSLDERVPRDFIAECGADLVINIVDAANLARTLFPGWVTPFVMELPRYRLPTPPGVLTHAWERTRAFVVSAGRIIVPLVLLLNVLNSVGLAGSFGNEAIARC